LSDLAFETADELEICVKPYKYRVEVDAEEWKNGRANITRVLKQELQACESAKKSIEEAIGGRRKTSDVVSFIERVRKGEVVLENQAGGAGGFSSALLEKGKEALFLSDRASILKMRIAAVQSRQCGTPGNKVYCPEVFLDAVGGKLTNTADLFLDAELLSKFYYQFPRVLEKWGRELDEGSVERLAREDVKVRRHLDVVRRKEGLEMVLREMEGLRLIEGRERGREERRKNAGQDSRRKGWFS